MTFAKESRTIVELRDDMADPADAFVDDSADGSTDDSADDLDPTFDDLDDPDGLLRNGLAPRPELLDDEALDLLGDVDEEPAYEIIDNRAGTGGRTSR